MGRVEGYRNFCNKIWNAARYVLENTEGHDCGQTGNPVELSLADRWIISKLQQVEAEIARHIEQFRFDLASQTLYDFIWNEYCSWYLELTKPVLNDEEASEEAKRGTRRTLVRVLETSLRLIHPMMPFISEEIWQKLKGLAGVEGETIMLQPYPTADESKIDQAAIDSIDWLKQVILAVRNIRGEMNIAPGKPLPVLFAHGTESDRQQLTETQQVLTKLARLESITWLAESEEGPASATQLAGELEVKVPMAGLIDKEAELARLNKEIDKLSNEIKRLEGKLNNQNFVAKAPEEVVAKEQQKLAEAKAAIDKFEEQKEKLATL